MAVTIPMIMSKIPAMQRSPPQEVKSTYDETQVINRMKVKSIGFKPHERAVKIIGKRGKKINKSGRTCHAPAKNVTYSS